MIDKFYSWLTSLGQPTATLLAAMLAGCVTIVIAVITLLIKDLLFPILTEKRAAAKKRKETFKLYANPLILSSISLLFRLKEVLSHRGAFLSADAPKTDFYEYKKLSTIYRFCSFLGWIRAAAQELSFVEVKSSSEYDGIQSAISEFEKALADGHDLEIAILDDLATLWNIDLSNLNPEAKEALGADVERITDKHIFKGSVSIVIDLPEEKKFQLARELNNKISSIANASKASDDALRTSLVDFARELSRKDGLIYRDWQAAIGEQMLRNAEKESSRRYRVIGYREFELSYLGTEAENVKWFTRASKIFLDLEVGVEERFDGRKKQLRLVYSSVYNVLQALSEIKTSDVEVASKALEKLPAELK